MTYSVARLGHRGDGVIDGAGAPIFAPGALPGEQVTGTLNGDRLDDLRIVTPSARRIRPPCPHARACGGCLMQHAADPLVAAWKTDIVAGALAGQGLSAEILPILTSPSRSRRRAVIAGRRTKSGGVMLGFHARASDTLVAVPECHLLTPGLMATFPALQALVQTGGARGAEMAFTVTETASGPDVLATGGKPADAALRLDLARLTETHALARLTWGDEVVALRASPMLRLGPAQVAMPPGAFLQATAQGEAALLSAVQHAIGPARRIADLFCGLGTFSLPLAAGAEVLAFESDAAMVAALDRAARTAPGLHRITATSRDLFRRPLEPDELKGLDAAVIDPPRAGAEAQSRTLARSDLPLIAAVSCNPVTFARDARILIDAGWRIDWVQPVDQFRWSAHVELAARLSRQ